MNVGVIGLGKMGMSITKRLISHSHTVFAYDVDTKLCKNAGKCGAQAISDLKTLSQKVTIFWIMVPAGKTVDMILEQLTQIMQPKSIVIDGGNSHFKDSIKRAQHLEQHSFNFLDCGTSGGIHGETEGFSLMIGGNQKIFKQIESIFQAIASPQGYAHMGPAGSGHYVKMVHNGIEYALLQSYAEGLHLLKEGHYKNLDLQKITNVWNHSSVIRSWILQLLEEIFTQEKNIESISGEIEENNTGRWTLEEARKQNIPTHLIEKSLEIRSWSRKNGGNYGTKLVALLRKYFGGHKTKKKF